MASEPHRVVIIGTGFGGLFATRALAGAPVEVTLIDRTPVHLFQPLLYQVATGILSEGEIAPPVRNILRRQKNVRTLLGDVEKIDVAGHAVTSRALGTTTVSPYDSLIVAAGAHTSYFGHEDEYARFAPGLKTIDDALDIRSRIFSAFEAAELETRPDARAQWLTFVIVGAGATGVEMAGQISELSERSLRRNFRSIDPGDARIVLVDAAPEPLPAFGNRLSEAAAKELERLGIELWLDTRVVGVDENGIDLEDGHGSHTRIAARTKIWSAGVAASALGRHLAEQTGAQIERGGRIAVRPDLTLPGHPEIFVVGDMIALDDLPGVSPVAIQSGRYAADQIERRARGRGPAEKFRYFDKGSMATISRFHAVASIGPVKLRGTIAWFAWLFVHLFYLVGFKNRLTTLFHWTVSFLGSDRSERSGARQAADHRSA